MRRLFWPLVWVVAVGSLSQLFAAGRAWSTALSVGFVLSTGAWLVLFIGALFLLTLRMYAIERAQDHVVHRVAVFERLLERGADGVD